MASTSLPLVILRTLHMLKSSYQYLSLAHNCSLRLRMAIYSPLSTYCSRRGSRCRSILCPVLFLHTPPTLITNTPQYTPHSSFLHQQSAFWQEMLCPTPALIVATFILHCGTRALGNFMVSLSFFSPFFSPQVDRPSSASGSVSQNFSREYYISCIFFFC